MLMLLSLRIDGGIHTAICCDVTPYVLVYRYKHSYENVVRTYEITHRHIPTIASLSTRKLTRGNTLIKYSNFLDYITISTIKIYGN
jgi:hypothetical protein